MVEDYYKRTYKNTSCYISRISKFDDKAIDELVEINKKVGINLAFEGGEAETLAVDGPIFKKRINILKDKKIWHLDSGLYIIEEAELEDK